MTFKKNEIVELMGGKKYIVANILNLNEQYYYYLFEIDPNEKEVVDNVKIVTTIRENGSLFVKTVRGSLYDELINLFNRE